MLCRDCVSLLTSCPPVDREVCRILEQRKPSTLRGKGASCGSAREGDAGAGSGAGAAAHSTSGSSEAVIPRFFFKVCPRAPRVACSPHTRFQPATDPLSTTFEMAARRHALRNKINELPSEDVRSPNVILSPRLYVGGVRQELANLQTELQLRAKGGSRITYEDFCEVRDSMPPKMAPFFKPSVFVKVRI